MRDKRKRTRRTQWFGFDQSPSMSRPGWYEIREKGKPVFRIWRNGNNFRLNQGSDFKLSIVFCILHQVKWRGLAEKPE